MNNNHIHEKLKEYLINNGINIDSFTTTTINGENVIKIETDLLEEHFIKYEHIKDEIKYILLTHSLKLDKLLKQFKQQNNILKPFTGDYIGVDESGKGDYFGPLVAVGFISNEKIDQELIHMGVKDSKKYKDDKIISLAKELIKKYPENFCVKELEPETYNKIISQYRLINKNQKDILAELHDAVIDTLIVKHDIKGVIADAVDMINRDHILKYFNNNIIDAIETPNGENNMAVAAAGIIARYHFLLALEELSKSIGIPIPKGASSSAINTGRKIVKMSNKRILKKYAKIHFKTTTKILSNLK